MCGTLPAMRSQAELREIGNVGKVLGVGPDVGSAPLVVAIHGRGQKASWMQESFSEIALDSGATWLFPEAPAGTWWPEGFMAESASNAPYFGESLREMNDIDGALSTLQVSSVVWLGFSQGACLAVEHVVRQASSAVGLIALTGAHVGPPGTDLLVAQPVHQLPVLLSSGERDPWLPQVRLRATADALRVAGADVEVACHDDADHRIRPEELVAVAAFIERVLDPRDDGSRRRRVDGESMT